MKILDARKLANDSLRNIKNAADEEICMLCEHIDELQDEVDRLEGILKDNEIDY